MEELLEALDEEQSASTEEAAVEDAASAAEVPADVSEEDEYENRSDLDRSDLIVQDQDRSAMPGNKFHINIPILAQYPKKADFENEIKIDIPIHLAGESEGEQVEEEEEEEEVIHDKPEESAATEVELVEQKNPEDPAAE